jgi:hypothetical protein
MRGTGNMNRTVLAVLVLVFAFAGRTAMARTPWCSAEILAPGAGATFRTGGALTYPVYFSSHHVYLVNNPPPVLYLSVSGGADLYRDAATVQHANLPSQMTVSNWPYPASGFPDLYGTVTVYLGGHYGSAASNIWYNLAQATASQQIIFSVVMY